MRVLIIEDDPASRDLAKRIVESQGHSVAIAADGHEGIRIAHADRPQLIMLDLHLPDLPGWMVARQLRDDVVLRDVPIIAVSAGSPDDRDRAIAAGCSDFVSKPYDPNLLRSVVDLQQFRAEGHS